MARLAACAWGQRSSCYRKQLVAWQLLLAVL